MISTYILLYTPPLIASVNVLWCVLTYALLLCLFDDAAAAAADDDDDDDTSRVHQMSGSW